MINRYNLRKTPIIKRLIPSLTNRFFSWTKRTSVVRNSMGLNLLLDVKSFVDRNIIYWGGWEVEQIKYLEEQIAREQADVFLDIGAYFGLYALYVKKHFPHLEVHAFEPQPENRDQLLKNLALNYFSNDIEVHPYGLSDTTKKAYISNKADNRGKAIIGIETPTSEEIKITKLDDVMTLSKKTVFVKIDVEGYEEKVLNGMSHFLEQNKCFLQIECWMENKEKFQSCLDEKNLVVVNKIDNDYFVKNF